MCSVVGYIGKNYCRSFIMEGLSRLEYRGYDSSGFACLDPQDNRLMYVRSQGRLQNLAEKLTQHPLDGHLAVGHTRWSTHGAPTEDNAHPQFDCQKTLSIVHNGIVENFHELKEELIAAGHVFYSQTDTEVIAHGLEAILATTKSLKAAVTSLVNRLEGAYAFIVIMQDHPDHMIAVRKRSPLCLGVGTDEMYIASDALAFAGKTKKVLYMPDESFALVRNNTYELYSFAGKPLQTPVEELHLDWTDNGKMGHEHFMLKEIYEQKNAIVSTVKFYQDISSSIGKHMGLSKEHLKNLENMNLIGCGTSWHAARIGQFFFEKV